MIKFFKKEYFMERSNAKRLVNLIHFASSNSCNEREFFREELKNMDINFLVEMENGLESLKYIINELYEEKSKTEYRYTIPEDSFDRLGY
jgi:hypothetical protein